jgi:hypothetical protein|tara:strand:+ start:246 stop:512 length:267 start_codon:yes stop_codon:yes gene_type:complete
MSYDNNMKGVLFENEKTKETQPDFTGSIVIDEKEYRLAAWNNVSKAGKPFKSIKAQPKEEADDYKNTGPTDKPTMIENPETFKDDIPF